LRGGSGGSAGGYGGTVTTGKVSKCGDGILDPGEQCDDGNTIPGDGCNGLCQVEVSATGGSNRNDIANGHHE
jgi:cysteine-rich repeat protein